VKEVMVTHAGQFLPSAHIKDITPGATYNLNVFVPA